MIKRLLVIMLSGAVTLSCLSGKYEYSQPNQYPIQTKSIVIEKPKEEVWNSLMAHVASSFFVINNIEKVSGFINLSYAGPPCNYVDCGWLTSEVTNARGTRNYGFPGCSEYQQYELYERQNGMLYYYQRTMKLEGRINILVQEEQPSRTRVTTNVRYMVTKVVNVNPGNRVLNDTIQFDTGGYAAFPGALSSCRPNHKLEEDALKMVKGETQ
jgi:hypothetical protein